MRAPGEVVSAFEAKLGVKLEPVLAEELSERLLPLENRFESVDAVRFGEALASRVRAGPALQAELDGAPAKLPLYAGPVPLASTQSGFELSLGRALRESMPPGAS